MGAGPSTLGTWRNAWRDARNTDANEEQRARPPDEPWRAFAPVTVAEVQAFEQEQAAQRRGPHPDALPMPWQATALQLWAHLTQTARQVRQAPAPTRHVRSAPEDSANAAGAQPAAPGAHHFAPASGAANAGGQHLASELDKLEHTLLAGTAFHFPEDVAEATRQVRQTPTPHRHIRHARHRYISRHTESWQISRHTESWQISRHGEHWQISRHGEHWQASRQAAVGTSDNAEPAQPAAPSVNQSASASSADNAGGLPVRPAQHAADGGMIRSQLDQLDPSLLPDYLTTQGYAEVGQQSGCAQDTAVLMALHKHLAPARGFVGDPASLDRLDSDACANLMRHVARERGFYGARDGEQSAPEFQRQLLIRLVYPWVMDCAPASGTSTAAPGLQKAHETMARIKEGGIGRLQASGLTADAAEWVAGLLWADVEPTVARADTPGDLHYGSLEWADLQTGIDLAGAVGLDHWSMTYTELVSLAQTSDMAVRQHPDAAAELLAPQVRAALTFADIAIEPDDPDSGKRIEQALTLLNEARSARWEAAQHKLEALEMLQAPMPMRSEIGAQILREHGIDPVQKIVVQRKRFGVRGEHVEHPDQTMLSRYMGGDRSYSLGGNGEERVLPDLDPLFNKTFTQYKSSHQRAFTVLFDYAVQALPKQDRTFWQRGDAQILVPEVRDQRSLEQGSLATRPVLADSLPRAKPFTAIVAITHDGQTRHYLAAIASAEGRLIRLIAGALPRDAGASPGNAKILDDALFPYIDDLVTQGSAVKAAEQRRWKLVPGGAPGRAIPVLAEYFVEATEKLRDQAYQPTKKQRFEQAVRDGLMSMIPLYDCASEVQDGTAGGVIFSCGLDIGNLAPGVGPAFKTGVGIGKLVVRFNISALRQLANAAATGSFRRALSKVAGNQAKLVGSGGKALAWEAVQAFDPGFQLFHLAGKGLRSVGKGLRSSGKGLQALLSTLRQEPALQTLADRVTGLLTRSPFHFDARAGVWQMHADAVTRRESRRVAQVGEREMEVIDLGDVPRVPVVRVAERADARFVLVEPLQGRPYGPQWVPTADGFAALGDYRVRLADPVPDPDAGGIVHVGQRDYIQVDAEYYPVRHDADRQSWRIYRENEPDGAPIPVRYDASSGRWTVQGDDGASGAVAARRPSLGDLPNEMQSGIASHFSDGGTGSMSQVNRHWDELLTQERRASQLAEEARSVGSLAQMRGLLGAEGMAGIQDLRMSLRDRPLVALTQRIGALPELERLAAFHYLYEAINALPLRDRGMPLAVLANRLGDLAAAYRQTEYRRIFDETLRLEPRHRAGPLAVLAGQVGQLEKVHPVRWNAFNELIRETLVLDARHRAAPLAALATAIPHLPESARLNRFDLVFDEVGPLPMGQRAGPLASLSGQVGSLHRIDRQPAFERILEQIGVLPARHAAGPLTSLSAQIEALPRIDRQSAFERILEQIGVLPAQYGAGPLALLSGQIGSLLDGQRAFNRILERIDALPAEYRAVPLAALTDQVPMLPADGWLQPFDGIIRAALWLDAGGHGAPLARVMELIVELPPERRLAAVRSLLHAVETLDPERRGEQYTQLARRIFQLPAPQRLDGFDAVFSATIRLPAERRAIPLAELTANFSWMPKIRQPDEFNRILGQIDALPAEHRDQLLKALTNQVRELPPEDWPEAFERLVVAAALGGAGVQGEPLLRLARIVGQLPEERQAAAFDRLIDATAPLDAGVRGEQLMRLARLGERLPFDRLAAFRSLLRAVETLDAERRGEHYVQFSWLIGQLPEHQRPALFDAVFAAALALPTQYRVVPLEALTAGIYLLPGSWRLDAIRRVGSEMNALSPQTWNTALTALVQQFESLPERRLEMFAALTRASALTSPENRAALLRMLTDQIRFVDPPADRGRAWRSVLRETETLAPQPRAMAHAALASQIEAIQWDQDRITAFNDLLAAIRTLPPQHRTVPLIAAADNIRLLPGPGQQAAFDRIRDNRAAAHVE